MDTVMSRVVATSWKEILRFARLSVDVGVVTKFLSFRLARLKWSGFVNQRST
jgi:hypothetical protein